MRKNTYFFKKICAITVGAALMMGAPISVYATDLNGVSEEQTEVSEEADDADEVTDEAVDVEEIVTDVSADENAEEISNEASDVNDEAVSNVADENIEEASGDAVSEDAAESEEQVSIEDSEEAAVTDEAVSEDATESTDTTEATDSEESTLPTSLLMLDPDPDDELSVEDSTEGTGSMLITTVKRPKNVVSVVVPILDSYSYDFILDPDNLLSLVDTNNIIGEGGTVYFKQKDAENTYSIYSDIVTAVNKSTVPVDFDIELTLLKDADLPLSFTGMGETYTSSDPVLSFAIVPTEFGTVTGNEPAQDTTPIKSEMAITDENGVANKELVLPGVIDNFDVVTKPTEDPNFYTQEYVVKEDSQWPTVGFALYGSCSKEADWSEVATALYKGKKLSLTLTYKLTPILEDMED